MGMMHLPRLLLSPDGIRFPVPGMLLTTFYQCFLTPQRRSCCFQIHSSCYQTLISMLLIYGSGIHSLSFNIVLHYNDHEQQFSSCSSGTRYLTSWFQIWQSCHLGSLPVPNYPEYGISLYLSQAFSHLSKPLHILSNNSALTIHELSNGHASLAASILSSRPYHSISALTEAFNYHLWPMRCQSSTRSSNWRYWNMVITWALSWNVVHHILPMSLDTLKAFTFDLVSFGCTSAVIKSCWAAIQIRHKEFEYTPPIHGSGQYSAWERCIASALGAPARIRFPVPKSIVHSLFLWRSTS